MQKLFCRKIFRADPQILPGLRATFQFPEGEEESAKVQIDNKCFTQFFTHGSSPKSFFHLSKKKIYANMQ